MEREIILSSFVVKNVKGNRPGDFTTKFNPTLNLDEKDARYYIGFNRIIDFAQGVWTNYIKDWTKTTDGDGKDVFAITLTSDEPTFRVITTLAANYQLDLTNQILTN